MISAHNLTKYYGEHLAVDNLSFEIDEGHVYGFLGPNGAGKSTTMNIMTGCLSASAGSVRIDGYDIFDEPQQAKRLIGYLPEQPPLYMNESPLEYLTFVGEAKGLRGAQLREQIREVIQRTGIESVAHRRISQLSKGYKQRVGMFTADFETVTAIDITLEGVAYHLVKYIPSEEDSQEEALWKYGETEIDITEIQSELSSLTAESFTAADAAGKEEIRMVIHMENDHADSLQIVLYRQNGEYCLCQLNGVSTAMISRSKVVDLMEAANAIVLN